VGKNRVLYLNFADLSKKLLCVQVKNVPSIFWVRDQ